MSHPHNQFIEVWMPRLPSASFGADDGIRTRHRHLGQKRKLWETAR